MGLVEEAKSFAEEHRLPKKQITVKLLEEGTLKPSARSLAEIKDGDFQ